MIVDKTGSHDMDNRIRLHSLTCFARSSNSFRETVHSFSDFSSFWRSVRHDDETPDVDVVGVEVTSDTEPFGDEDATSAATAVLEVKLLLAEDGVTEGELLLLWLLLAAAVVEEETIVDPIGGFMGFCGLRIETGGADEDSEEDEPPLNWPTRLEKSPEVRFGDEDETTGDGFSATSRLDAIGADDPSADELESKDTDLSWRWGAWVEVSFEKLVPVLSPFLASWVFLNSTIHGGSSLPFDPGDVTPVVVEVTDLIDEVSDVTEVARMRDGVTDEPLVFSTPFSWLFRGSFDGEVLLLLET